MIKRPDWIVCSQEKEALGRFKGCVVWVNRCLRCNVEEPVCEGLLEIAISKSERFIRVHIGCEAIGD